MTDTHTIQIQDEVRDLPLREVAPGVRVALFDITDDWELTEVAAQELAQLIPDGVDALVMPAGKAVPLLHFLGAQVGLPIFVARKEKKLYTKEPVVEVEVKSITTGKPQTLHFGADKVESLAGLKVAFVDDVISSGGTLVAMQELLNKVGAELVATVCIFTEGDEREGVISLGHIPLFKD